jgi:hypothetical protein
VDESIFKYIPLRDVKSSPQLGFKASNEKHSITDEYGVKSEQKNIVETQKLEQQKIKEI